MSELKTENLFIEDIELFEGNYLIDGYYGENYFKIDIEPEKNEFTLIDDDTKCTDKELKFIYENVKQYCNQKYITK